MWHCTGLCMSNAIACSRFRCVSTGERPPRPPKDPSRDRPRRSAERDEPDTGAPGVRISANASLRDAATGAVLLAADAGPVTPADAVPPVVASTSPADGADPVSIWTTVRIGFSEAMDRTAAEGAFSISPAVSGRFAWRAGSSGEAMVFVPASPLADGAVYTVTVGAAARDISGNALADIYEFSFTTGVGLGVEIPAASAVSPAFIEGHETCESAPAPRHLLKAQ